METTLSDLSEATLWHVYMKWSCPSRITYCFLHIAVLRFPSSLGFLSVVWLLWVLVRPSKGDNHVAILHPFINQCPLPAEENVAVVLLHEALCRSCYMYKDDYFRVQVWLVYMGIWGFHFHTKRMKVSLSRFTGGGFSWLPKTKGSHYQLQSCMSR